MNRPNASSAGKKGKTGRDESANQPSSSTNPNHPTSNPPTHQLIQPVPPFNSLNLAAFPHSLNPAMMNLMAMQNGQFGFRANSENQPSTSNSLQPFTYGHLASPLAPLPTNSYYNFLQNMYMAGLINGQFNPSMNLTSMTILPHAGSHTSSQTNIVEFPNQMNLSQSFLPPGTTPVHSNHSINLTPSNTGITTPNLLGQPMPGNYPPLTDGETTVSPYCPVSDYIMGSRCKLLQDYQKCDAMVSSNRSMYLVRCFTPLEASYGREADLPGTSTHTPTTGSHGNAQAKNSLQSSAKKKDVDYPTHSSQLEVPREPDEFEDGRCTERYFAKFVEGNYQLEDVLLNERTPPWRQIVRCSSARDVEEELRMIMTIPSIKYTQEWCHQDRKCAAMTRRFYIFTLIHWMTAPDSVRSPPTPWERWRALREFAQFTHEEKRRLMEYAYLYLSVEQGCYYYSFVEQLIAFQTRKCTEAPEWPYCSRDEDSTRRGGFLRSYFTPSIWTSIVNWWEQQLNLGRCLKDNIDAVMFELASKYPEADRETSAERRELIRLKWETAKIEHEFQEKHWEDSMKRQREKGEDPADPRKKTPFFFLNLTAGLNHELLSPYRKQTSDRQWIGRDLTALNLKLNQLQSRNDAIMKLPNHEIIDSIPLDDFSPPVITVSDYESESIQDAQRLDDHETSESHPTDPSSAIVSAESTACPSIPSSTSITHPVLQSSISTSSSSSCHNQSSISPSSGPDPSSTSSSSIPPTHATVNLPSTNSSSVDGVHNRQVPSSDLEDTKDPSPTSSDDLPSPTDDGGKADPLSSSTSTSATLADPSTIELSIEKTDASLQTDSLPPSPSLSSSQPTGDVTTSSSALMRMTGLEILASLTPEQISSIRDVFTKLPSDDPLSISKASSSGEEASSHHSTTSPTAQGEPALEQRSVLPPATSSLLPTQPPIRMKISNGSSSIVTSSSLNESKTESQSQPSSSIGIPPSSVITFAPPNSSSSSIITPSSSLNPSAHSATLRLSSNVSNEDEDEPSPKILRRTSWHLPFLVLPAHITLNKKERRRAEELTNNFWDSQEVEDRAWLRARTLQLSATQPHSSTINRTNDTISPTNRFTNAFEDFKRGLDNEEDRILMGHFTLTTFQQLFFY